MGKTGVNHWWSRGLHEEARIQQVADASMHLDEDGWRSLCGAFVPGQRYSIHKKIRERERERGETATHRVTNIRMLASYPHFALMEVVTNGEPYRECFLWQELALLHMNGAIKKSRSE